MALKLSDVIAEMKQVTMAGGELPPGRRSKKIIDLAADFLLRALAQDPESGRVAVLMLTNQGRHLVFAYPESLARGNTLLLDRQSIAGRVILGKQTLVENDVPKEPHKEFFERIPDPDGQVRLIQKMVAAPLLDRAGKAFGVVEVSRTGVDSSSAGADFTEVDGINLGKCCQAFAPYFARNWVRD